jgi:glutamine synthetase
VARNVSYGEFYIKMLAPDQLSSFNTVVLGVPDTWGRFVGKRFESDFFSSSVQAKGSTIGAYMAGCDLENNPIDGIVDPTGPDYKVVPDMTTLRRFAWLDDTCGVIGDVFDASGAPVNVFPRAILKNVLEKAKEHGFGGAKAASELEFLTVEETMPTLVRNGFTSITPTGGHETAEYNHLYELRERSVIFPLVEKVKECGIVPEGFLGEAGPNQHELNIHYDDALKMADDTMIFKHCIKQHAQSVGRSATFMPKYEENGIGNSCHIHFNMTDESGSNAFTGDETL